MSITWYVVKWTNVCWHLVVLTYLCLFARWEHRPSTKERHRFLSVAIFSISPLVYPISFVSSSVSLCQVFRGLILRLFPGGFHVMAWLVFGGFLSVCPIHLHFLFFISFSKGSCLVIFQSVVLDILSVHFQFGCCGGSLSSLELSLLAILEFEWQCCSLSCNTAIIINIELVNPKFGSASLNYTTKTWYKNIEPHSL